MPFIPKKNRMESFIGEILMVDVDTQTQTDYTPMLSHSPPRINPIVHVGQTERMEKKDGKRGRKMERKKKMDGKKERGKKGERKK